MTIVFRANQPKSWDAKGADAGCVSTEPQNSVARLQGRNHQGMTWLFVTDLQGTYSNWHAVRNLIAWLWRDE